MIRKVVLSVFVAAVMAVSMDRAFAGCGGCGSEAKAASGEAKKGACGAKKGACGAKKAACGAEKAACGAEKDCADWCCKGQVDACCAEGAECAKKAEGKCGEGKSCGAKKKACHDQGDESAEAAGE